MIRYTLRCADDHGFEAWFRNSETYDEQASKGLLSCPVCGSSDVGKAPMAPNIGRSSGPASDERPGEAPADPRMLAKAAAMRRHLIELRTKVEQNCDYVGRRFAEEARRIHYGETEARGIYGETSKDEAKALRDEGVAFAAIPWVEKDHA